jgi:excisionase family DNA binding protein
MAFYGECRMSDKDFPLEIAALSVREAAAYLNAGESTVWKLIRENKLPAKRLGSRTIILRADAEQFLHGLPSARRAP